MLDSVIQNLPMMVSWKDQKGNYLGGNTAFLEAAGFESISQLVGKNDFEMPWAKTHALLYMQNDLEVISSGKPKIGIEESSVDAEGKIHYFRTNRVPLEDANGNSIGVLTTSEDITDSHQVIKDLQKQSEELDAYFSNALDLFCIASSEGYFLRLNPQWEDCLGYKLDELMGKPFLEFVHPDDIPATLAEMERLDENKPILSFSNRYLAKDGSYRHIEWRSRSINGTIYAAARDVTEKHTVESALAASEKRFQYAIAATNDAIWDFANESGLYWSPKYYTMLGYDVDEFPPSIESWKSLLHPEDLETAQQQLLDCFEGKTDEYRAECRFRTKQGEYRWILVRGRVMERDSQGRVQRMTGTHTDITEGKQMENSLRESESKLKRSHMEKDRFFSIIAHDLRSPFQALMGFAELIEEDSQLEPKEWYEIGRMLSDLTQNTYQLLNNLLNWALENQGAITFTPVLQPLRPFVDQELKTLIDVARKKQIHVINLIEDNVELLLDAKMMGTVLRNLVSNAIKFSPKGSTIQLSADNSDPEWLRVSVVDQGIGLPDDMLDQLFDIGGKSGRPGTEGETSCGLGLVLCREFVQKHGGRIGVDSTVGAGSTFWFVLPKQ